MRGGRHGTLADGLRHLHRTPDLAAMRAARSPDELARLAIVPATRNLGIAAGFLPARLRSEATAALLACRVLDAYKDLSARPLAAMQAHRAELSQVWRAADFEKQQDYLETVVELSRRGAVSRLMYLAEVHAPRAA